MTNLGLSCNDQLRREAVRSASVCGLDYVEVLPSQTTLIVYFLGKMPQRIVKENVVISGGTRITGIRVSGISPHRHGDAEIDDSMEVRVDKPGDFSTYTLKLVAVDPSDIPTTQPMAGFDPIFSKVDFTFKGGSASDFDCLVKKSCPSAPTSEPEFHYLAKDYNSFRKLIFDRLALTMPGWQETHEPDIGVAIVELLAYTADYLSYYQDAVATEAYLGTARQRISIRRHARLIDYAMHEGCNARAWLTLLTPSDQDVDLDRTFFITAFPGAPGGSSLSDSALASVPASDYEVFQPLLPGSGSFPVYEAHNSISFYTWGDALCCLPMGAVAATLVDQYGKSKEERALHLKAGDYLIFEEVLGPLTGNPADADPTHRQVVQLTKVTASFDTLYDQPIVEIEWAAEDATAFPLCLSSRLPAPDCNLVADVTVARGNVVLTDHGATTVEVAGTVPTAATTATCASLCAPAQVQNSPGPFRPILQRGPLTFSQSLPSGSAPASHLDVQNPAEALPQIALSSIPPSPAPPIPSSSCISPLFTFADIAKPTALAHALKEANQESMQYLAGRLSATTRKLLAKWNGADPLPEPAVIDLQADLNSLLKQWLPASDLLESGSTDLSFVAEMDNAAKAHLRFGDGNLGRRPDAGMNFQASYRVGNGTAGNVGAETIVYLVTRGELLSGNAIQPRNPLQATGGIDGEDVTEVKLLAPHAFQDILERAITADDYATLAADNARRQEERPTRDSLAYPFVPLQGAKATLRWTGACYEALVAVDPVNSEQPSSELLSEIRSYLEPYRRIGHDVTVVHANYVPLDLALSICVLPDYLRGNVEQSLLQVLGNGVLPDGRYGLFHPNKLTFGGGVYVSNIVAAAQGVTGVASVVVTRLERLRVEAHPYRPAFGLARGAVPASGVLPLGPFEIAQLDNDPNFPEHGRIKLSLRGGR
jgi:hypothetical protein